MPGYVMADGDRLPASYANFYIANEVVLAPVYGHANDAAAIGILQGLFPAHRIVPDPVRAAGVGHGLDPLRHPAAAAIALRPSQDRAARGARPSRRVVATLIGRCSAAEPSHPAWRRSVRRVTVVPLYTATTLQSL